MYWYDTELDSVERGLMNLAAAKVELIEELESIDDVSRSIVVCDRVLSTRIRFWTAWHVAMYCYRRRT